MATLKREEIKQLSDPIIIEAGILGEKEYRVEKITTDMLIAVDRIHKEAQGALDVPIKQLAFLLGVQPEEFNAIDLRTISKVLTFLMENTISKVNSAKTPTVAEVK